MAKQKYLPKEDLCAKPEVETTRPDLVDARVLWELKADQMGPEHCRLRLVSFGGDTPVIEKRQFILENGKERGGRVRGFMIKDIVAIQQNWPVIHREWIKFKK